MTEYDPGELQRWLSDIVAVTNECRVTAADGALSAEFLDEAHVSMHASRCAPLAPSDFNDEFAIDAKPLLDIVKRDFKGAGAVAVDIDGGFLRLQHGRRTRRLALVDLSTIGDPRKPNLTYPSSATLVDAAPLIDAIASLGAISDMLRFTIDDGTLTVGTIQDSSKGDYSDKSGNDEFDCATDGPRASSVFSSDKLIRCIFPKHRSGAVTLRIADDYPICVEYENSEHMLAPRIEQD